MAKIFLHKPLKGVKWRWELWRCQEW